MKRREPTLKWVEKLNRIGIALSSEHSIEKLLAMIVRSARELTNADAGSLYSVSGGMLHFEVMQSSALGTCKISPRSFPIDTRRISGYVAATGNLVNIPDVYHLPPGVEYGFTPDFDRRMGYRTKSILAVPMQEPDGDIIGVLQLINALSKRRGKIPDHVVPFRPVFEGILMSLASQAAVAIMNARLINEVKHLFAAFVEFYAAQIDARDPTCAGHSRRVRELSLRIARAIHRSRTPPFDRIEFNEEKLEALGYAAWLHDVGKIGVKEHILTKANKLWPCEMDVIRSRFELAKKLVEIDLLKGRLSAKAAKRKIESLEADLALIERAVVPAAITEEDSRRLRAVARKTYPAPGGGRKPLLTRHELECLLVRRGSLTSEELRQVRMHARLTLDFLRRIPFRGWLKDVPTYAHRHHELLDGSGYPFGLKAAEIPCEARILTIADVFDALTASDRPYRKALPVRKALKVLRSEAAAGRLDKDIVELMIRNRLYRLKKDPPARSNPAKSRPDKTE